MKKRFSLTTTHVIMIGFLLTILTGTFFLSLPISSAHGNAASFWDALFTATTATCVTGLVVIPTVSSWSVFGQVVILLLIQIGGLGVVTIMSGLMILLHKKMGINDRLLLQDAFNLNSLSGLVRFVKKSCYRNTCHRRNRCSSIYDSVYPGFRSKRNMDFNIYFGLGLLQCRY